MRHDWFGILAAAATVLGVSLSCSKTTPPPAATNAASSVHALSTKTNHKYALDVLFYGEEVSLDNGTRMKAAQYLAIRDQHGKEVRFVPIDESSLSSSGGFFSEVWSPDEELLVLPLGRFEGFCMTPSSEAIRRISENRCQNSVRVQLKSGVRLWHEFHGWRDATTFSFAAGLSGKLTEFAYTVPNRKLVTSEKTNDNFVGITGQGQIPVVPAPIPQTRP
jgi:hypothetical protein